MKTKVTMKVKHFVTILFSVFVILPLVGLFLVPQVELVMAKHAFENQKAGAKEKVLAALESRILPSQKYDLISRFVIGHYAFQEYDILVGPSMSSNNFGEESQAFSWEEKLDYVKDYVANGPVDDGLYSAVERLGNYAVSQDDFDWAERIYEDALKRTKKSSMEHIYYDIALSYAKLLVREQELDRAEEHLLAMMKKMPESNAYILGEMAEYYFQTIIRKGNQDEAIAAINQIMDEHEENWRDPYENKTFEESDLYRKFVNLERRLHNTEKWSEESTITVSGHVKRTDGTPLANVGVYLRDEKYVNMSVTFDERHNFVTTDETGYYEVERVVPGDYQMFAGFTLDHIAGYTWPVSAEDWITVDASEDITYDITLAPLMEVYSPVNETVITDDELTFSWEEIPGAAYYTLGFMLHGEKGSAYGIGFGEEYTETEATLAIEELYYNSPTVLMDKEEIDMEFFDPPIYLGFTNPEGRFSWNVSAFDEDGNLLTRSNGYRMNEDTVGDVPVIHLKNRELIAADKLLMKGKVEEALAAYKQNVEENPEDTHSLLIITKIIGFEGDGTWSTFDELQLPYLEKLALAIGYDYHFEEVLRIHKNLENEAAYEKWEALYESESRGD